MHSIARLLVCNFCLVANYMVSLTHWSDTGLDGQKSAICHCWKSGRPSDNDIQNAQAW